MFQKFQIFNKFQMFQKFQNVDIVTEHFYPAITQRKGLLAHMYNHILIPTARFIPEWVMRPFGFHLVITGFKK